MRFVVLCQLFGRMMRTGMSARMAGDQMVRSRVRGPRRLTALIEAPSSPRAVCASAVAVVCPVIHRDIMRDEQASRRRRWLRVRLSDGRVSTSVGRLTMRVTCSEKKGSRGYPVVSGRRESFHRARSVTRWKEQGLG